MFHWWTGALCLNCDWNIYPNTGDNIEVQVKWMVMIHLNLPANCKISQIMEMVDKFERTRLRCCKYRWCYQYEEKQTKTIHNQTLPSSRHADQWLPSLNHVHVCQYLDQCWTRFMTSNFTQAPKSWTISFKTVKIVTYIFTKMKKYMYIRQNTTKDTCCMKGFASIIYGLARRYSCHIAVKEVYQIRPKSY